MKLYRTSKGTYCEKAEDFYNQQIAECGGRKCDYDHNGAIVEFPFSASPKSDFVAWMNERGKIDDITGPIYSEASPELVIEAKATPAPEQPPAQSPNWKADTVMQWVLDEADNADIENLFGALGARFHEAVR